MCEILHFPMDLEYLDIDCIDGAGNGEWVAEQRVTLVCSPDIRCSTINPNAMIRTPRAPNPKARRVDMLMSTDVSRMCLICGKTMPSEDAS